MKSKSVKKKPERSHLISEVRRRRILIEDLLKELKATPVLSDARARYYSKAFHEFTRQSAHLQD